MTSLLEKQENEDKTEGSRDMREPFDALLLRTPIPITEVPKTPKFSIVLLILSAPRLPTL